MRMSWQPNVANSNSYRTNIGKDHSSVATSLNNLAELYRQIGKEDEAERLEARAKKILTNN